MEKWREIRDEGIDMKYFDFVMLNKHFNEQVEFLTGLLWLAIYVIVIYTFVKWFLDWDN